MGTRRRFAPRARLWDTAGPFEAGASLWFFWEGGGANKLTDDGENDVFHFIDLLAIRKDVTVENKHGIELSRKTKCSFTTEE